MISKARAVVALALLILFISLGDAVQRTVITTWIRWAPSRRERILTAWLRVLAGGVMGTVHRIGGGKWDPLPVIPAAPGVLVLMNHQSLLDIPLVVKTIHGSYPQIVTRRRYLHPKYLLISHILKLYQFPIVDPGSAIARQTETLRRFAGETIHPLVIFPEGHRTPDGRIGPFKRGGLRGILGARTWQVYMIVIDGFWTCGRMGDFIANLGCLHGSIRRLGPFSSPEQEREWDTWIDEMHDLMSGELDSIRGFPSKGHVDSRRTRAGRTAEEPSP